MEPAEAVAREAIRDVISRYNHAGDRGRLGELSRCFAPDGVLDLENEAPIVGRDAIEARLSRVVQDFSGASRRPRLRHHVSSIRIRLESEDAATADAYFAVYTEVGLDHWGRYGDRFARIDGEWLIAQRVVRVDGAAPGSRMVDAPDPGA